MASNNSETLPFRVSTVTRKAAERLGTKPILKQFKVIYMNQAIEVSASKLDVPFTYLLLKVGSSFIRR